MDTINEDVRVQISVGAGRVASYLVRECATISARYKVDNKAVLGQMYTDLYAAVDQILVERASKAIVPSDALVEQKIIAIVSKIMKVPTKDLTPGTTFKMLRDKYGADSLDIIQVLVVVEEEYDIEVPDEAAREFSNLGDFVSYVLVQLSFR